MTKTRLLASVGLASLAVGLVSILPSPVERVRFVDPPPTATTVATPIGDAHGPDGDIGTAWAPTGPTSSTNVDGVDIGTAISVIRRP